MGDDLAVEHFSLAQSVAAQYCSVHGVPNSWYDDVVSWAQYGLVIAARKWDGEGIFRAYARRTMKNAIVDGFRHALGRHRQRMAMPTESSILESITIEERYEDVEQLDLVERIRSVLDPREFAFAVSAEFVERKQDVAEAWGVSPGRLSQVRGSDRIREILSPIFGRSP
jgi:RNA polymerase sigma factor (sigma-70 family)